MGRVLDGSVIHQNSIHLMRWFDAAIRLSCLDYQYLLQCPQVSTLCSNILLPPQENEITRPILLPSI